MTSGMSTVTPRSWSSWFWPNTAETELGTNLLEIPFFVRGLIFKYLSRKDQRNMRLVCKALQWNIDNSIEFQAILDTGVISSSILNPLSRRFSRNAAQQHLEEFLTWFETCKFQTLRVGNLGNLVFDTQRLFRNPLISQLILTLDGIQADLASLGTFSKILTGFNALKVLEIRFNNPTIKYDGLKYYKAHRKVTQFVADLLEDLRNKPNLEELTVSIHSSDNRRPGRVIIPEGPIAALAATVAFPFKLKILYLCLRDLTPEAILGWTALLDQQNELQSFAVDFGRRLSPDIYKNALTKSSGTLVHLGLKLYGQPTTTTNDPQQGIGYQAKTIDWSLLKESQLQLLKLWCDNKNMVNSLSSLPLWSLLPMNNLGRLNLRNIYLSSQDLTAIFYGTPKLKSLFIWNWTQYTAEVPRTNPELEADTLEIIHLLIERVVDKVDNQLQCVKLQDVCLNFCQQSSKNQLAAAASYYNLLVNKSSWTLKLK